MRHAALLCFAGPFAENYVHVGSGRSAYVATCVGRQQAVQSREHRLLIKEAPVTPVQIPAELDPAYLEPLNVAPSDQKRAAMPPPHQCRDRPW